MKTRTSFLLGAAMLLMCGRAFAGLTIDPSRTELVLPRAAVCQGTYTVRNDYDVPTKIVVETKDWYVYPENKGIGVDRWLAVPEREFKLLPGETKTVHYQVTVPTAAVGSLVGMTSFVPQNNSGEGFTLVVSVSMFVTVKGTEKVDWQILRTRFGGTLNDMQFTAEIFNGGNIYVRPTGTVEILSGKKKIAEFEIIEGRPVYPGLKRVILGRGENTSLKPGKYNARAVIKASGQERVKMLHFSVDAKGNVISQ